MRCGCWPSHSCLIHSGKRTWSNAGAGSIDDWAQTRDLSCALLVEAVRAVGWQVGERVGRVAAVAILEVDVRARGVAGGALVADDLALVHAVPGFDDVAEEVPVEREEVIAVGDDDVGA